MNGLFEGLLAAIERQPAKLPELAMQTFLPLAIAYILFWVGARMQTDEKPGWVKWALAAIPLVYAGFKCYGYFTFIRDTVYRDVLYSEGLNRVVYLHYAIFPLFILGLIGLLIWAGILRQMTSEAKITY